MNNFEINDRAQQLADTMSAYQLARNVVTLQAELAIIKANRADDIQHAVKRARAEWAAQADHFADLRKKAKRLQGVFMGCTYHGDDYEACIQHSGTAPCALEEELGHDNQ